MPSGFCSSPSGSFSPAIDDLCGMLEALVIESVTVSLQYFSLWLRPQDPHHSSSVSLALFFLLLLLTCLLHFFLNELVSPLLLSLHTLYFIPPLLGLPLLSLASGLSPHLIAHPPITVHKLFGIYSMWPDARFPLGAWFPGDGAGGLGCVTTGGGVGRG